MKVKNITIGKERRIPAPHLKPGTNRPTISGGHKVYFELEDGTILRTNMQFVTDEDKAEFKKAFGRGEVRGE